MDARLAGVYVNILHVYILYLSHVCNIYVYIMYICIYRKIDVYINIRVIYIFIYIYVLRDKLKGSPPQVDGSEIQVCIAPKASRPEP